MLCCSKDCNKIYQKEYREKTQAFYLEDKTTVVKTSSKAFNKSIEDKVKNVNFSNVVVPVLISVVLIIVTYVILHKMYIRMFMRMQYKRCPCTIQRHPLYISPHNTVLAVSKFCRDFFPCNAFFSHQNHHMV